MKVLVVQHFEKKQQAHIGFQLDMLLRIAAHARVAVVGNCAIAGVRNLLLGGRVSVSKHSFIGLGPWSYGLSSSTARSQRGVTAVERERQITNGDRELSIRKATNKWLPCFHCISTAWKLTVIHVVTLHYAAKLRQLQADRFLHSFALALAPLRSQAEISSGGPGL